MFVPLIFVALGVQLIAADSSCPMDAQGLKKMGMDCAVHEPGLMLEVMEHAANPRQLETFQFVCDHKSSLAQLAVCLEERLSHCVPTPQARHMLMDLLPNAHQIGGALEFVCTNQADFNSDCLTTSTAAQVNRCQQARLQSVMVTSDLTSTQGVKRAMCTMVKETESCLGQHHGKCSDKFVDKLDQLLELLFPTKDCQDISVTKEGLRKAGRGSLMVHDLPLRFQKENKAVYKLPRNN